MSIVIPQEVNTVLDMLRDHGFQAYVCGGCVRDAMLGRIPEDWDVTTSATPVEAKSVFRRSGCFVIDTGIKHGTVTVLVEDVSVEVTTYRVDGEYSDGRHPDSVEFTDRIEDDLARRDLTINAMAWDGQDLVDPYGGTKDMEDRILRCVGDPEERFGEDALRIMRLLRFAACLESDPDPGAENGPFTIEGATLKAAKDMAEKVQGISAERVTAELTKLLMGRHAGKVLSEYGDILNRALDMDISIYRRADAGNRIGCTVDVDRLPTDLTIRLAALDGLEMEKLRLDNKTKKAVRDVRALLDCGKLSNLREQKIPVKKLLKEYGEEAVRGGMILEGCDQRSLEEVLQAGDCYSLTQLAVTGKDLIELAESEGRSVTGPDIGETLEVLLEEVIEERVANDRGMLLEYAKEYMKNRYDQIHYQKKNV